MIGAISIAKNKIVVDKTASKVISDSKVAMFVHLL